MKKLPILMLSLLTLPAYAESILSTLNQHQSSLKNPEPVQTSSSSSSSSGSVPDVRSSQTSISSGSQKCEENDQTSLPLAYVTSLIQEKNGQLDVLHDQRTGTLTISAPDIIGNCSSMLEWTLKRPEILGKKAYAIEVKIKEGEDCSAEGCTYKVAKVIDGEFKEHKPMVLKPTLKGFEDCLQKSGVVSKGKVVPGAIYSTPVSEKFDGLEESGKLLFLSHGPSSPLVKAKYGKFEHVAACDYYESAHPQIKNVLTLADEEKERLDAEAAKLKGCKVDEYGKLADFIEKYEAYSVQLGEVRDRLILEAVKKSAAAIQAGKYTEEDLKVISDFEKYVVQPKIDLARELYDEMLELEGDAKKAKQEELKVVLAQISALNQKPYFLSAHTAKLIKDGRFEEAEKLNSIKLVLTHHQRLGARQENVVITPGIASQRIAAEKAAFADTLIKERERYEIRTGQVTGKSQYYANLAQRMRNNIETRTRNFTTEIQSEYARVQQPYGYCYKYWRNTQKCIQDTSERVQELQNLLNHYNQIDKERAAGYDDQAKDYAELEAQGRRYVAAQNGEAVEEEKQVKPVAAQEVDTTVPSARPQVQDTGVYTFNFSQGQQGNQQQYQQQAQMTPQQYQYPTNPYQNNNMFMQQNSYATQPAPWLGQQSYPYGNQNSYGYQGQGTYNFNWNGSGMQNQQYGYQQQQQSPYGYWNQPNQAYAGYSMYGQVR